MNDDPTPLGLPDGPREHWFAKVQIMGGPGMAWTMSLAPDTVESFLRLRMTSVSFTPEKIIDGQHLIDFAYTLPPGYIDTDGAGELRVSPAPGVSLQRLTYGMTYDLMEWILARQPSNTDLIIAFEGFRVLYYKPGLPRHEGIFRLTEDVDRALSAAMFPESWRN
jgi:hypothetical protein